MSLPSESLTRANSLSSSGFMVAAVLAWLVSLWDSAAILAKGPLSEDEFRDKYGMRAERCFTEPLNIELCQAIERNDLEAMRKAIAEGADVNARGKGGITPLFWAFPYHRVERFKLLLEAGADPNLPLTGDTGVKGFDRPGSTVNQAAWLSIATRPLP